MQTENLAFGNSQDFTHNSVWLAGHCLFIVGALSYPRTTQASFHAGTKSIVSIETASRVTNEASCHVSMLRKCLSLTWKE